MNLGFSDATLSVLKRGPGVRQQGELCRSLGKNVTTRVYRLLDDGYEMEMLEDTPSRSCPELDVVWSKLAVDVWTKPSVYWNDDWLDPLRVWSQLTAPWLLDTINELYPYEPEFGYSLIHGDPALSNLMLRGSVFVITDPMPRMLYRKEIPNRREVDWGKLLQSAMGWERVLGFGGHTLIDVPEYVLHRLQPQEQRLALLWAAVHLARIARRAPARNRQDVATWAEQTSRRLVTMCR